MTDNKKKILIIGAGPAGLTAAYELLTKTDYQPLIIEQLNFVGGISTTIEHHGNKIDIGGHRFFSKSDIVTDWWLKFLPLNRNGIPENVNLSYQGKKSHIPYSTNIATDEEDCLYIRERKSRILFNNNFFDYPLKLSPATLIKMGFVDTLKIGFSYIYSRVRPLPETNLENFFINRFGRQLYLKFFKDYTEKVWGVSCQEISADWGAQRIKGLSLRKAVLDYIKKAFKGKENLSKQEVESSLIEYFMYPKYGPGQLWSVVAAKVRELGGEILFNHNFQEIQVNPDQSLKVKIINTRTNEISTISPEYLISTAPMVELMNKIPSVPEEIKQMSQKLEYRDFITVGLLINKKYCTELQDTWIYVQTPNLKTGRVQIFNNWSPYLVEDPENMYWFGLEFFTTVGDDLWEMGELELKQLAAKEIVEMGLASSNAEIEDSVVIRVKKTYPSYIRGFKNFEKIKSYTDTLERIILIGRNGMHRYNNQDHSMLTAIKAVEQLSKGKLTRSEIWSINTEQEYHESK